MAIKISGTTVIDDSRNITNLGSALTVAQGGTGITSFGSGVATFLGTPSSANLAAAVTDETGSGALVFATSPTLTTPNIGAATGTSVNLTGAAGVITRAAATQDAVELVGRAGGTSSYKVSLTPTTLSASRTVTFPNNDINFATGLGVANGGTGITSFGTGVATALGTAINTTGGYVTQSGTLAANKVLLGGGSATAVTSTSLLGTAAAVTSGTYIQAVGYADTVVALGNTSTAINLDIVDGGVFTATLTGNATITLRFPVATGASSFTLILLNDASAGRTVAFAGGSFKFPGGAATLSRTTAANATDIWVFFTPDGGTTYFGNIAMKDVKA